MGSEPARQIWETRCVFACPAAYEVLSEPEKRRIYDRYGEEGLKEHEGRGGRGGGGGAQDIFSQCVFHCSLWQLTIHLRTCDLPEADCAAYRSALGVALTARKSSSGQPHVRDATGLIPILRMHSSCTIFGAPWDVPCFCLAAAVLRLIPSLRGRPGFSDCEFRTRTACALRQAALQG